MYQITHINLYNGDYTIVIYFNEDLKELMLFKENSESILSTIYLRDDYLKNKLIYEVTNKILFSKSFTLYKLFNFGDEYNLQKFVVPNEIDTITPD